ncbi:hypothetical protein ENSA7_82890 [Enhygromyxa salina]|uniref:Uncharacterized protein n=1 Tax=Enhygromyxa salina TaxID=215803 RepID=A0A2S9XC16_9BACT|nr:hypothetical protein ENSA7_82890 [Enhygromyxa salina]
MVVSSLGLATGCHRAVSGVDSEALGYGPDQPPQISGYDVDPVPRATPMPWTPPDRAGSPGSRSPVIGAAELSGPVPFADDIIEVCEHLVPREVAADAGQDADAVCRRQHRIAQVFRPIGDWKTLAACLGATTDVAGVDACRLATPSSVAPIAEHPRESGVCMHLLALSVVEELGPEPMLDAARLAEFRPLLADCVDSLVNDERRKLGPSNYATMLACVEVATTTADAERCPP